MMARSNEANKDEMGKMVQEREITKEEMLKSKITPNTPNPLIHQ